MKSHNRYQYCSIGVVLVGALAIFFDRLVSLGFCLCLLLIACNLIAAFVAMGDTRARAIGFLIPVIFLGTLIYFAGPRELKTSGAVLPHSRLIQSWVQRRLHTISRSGRPWSTGLSNQKGSELMLFAHVLFATSVGVAGAAYGQYTYNVSRFNEGEAGDS